MGFYNIAASIAKKYTQNRQSREKPPKSPFTVQSGAKPPASGATYSLPTQVPSIGASRTTPSQALASSGASVAPPVSRSGGWGVPRATTPERTGWGVNGSGGTTPATPSSVNTAASSAASQYLANESALLQSGNKSQAVQGSRNYTGGSQPTAPTTKPQIPTPASAGASAAANMSASNMQSLAQQNLARLQEQYMKTLTPTQREQELQRQLTDLQGATALGVSKKEGQGRGISLDLIRGQQAQLLEQGNLQAQTLQGQLANEQSARQAQIDALGAQLGFEDARVQREQAALDQDMANQMSMLQAGYQPVDPSQVTDPSTVVEIGGKTYLKPAAEAIKPTTTIQEYEYARQNGYTGSFTDYQTAQAGSSGGAGGDFNELLSVTEAQTLGVPYGTTRGQAYGISTEKPLSAEMLKLQSNVNSGISSLADIRATLDQDQQGGRALFASGEYRAAEANLLDIIGRLRSGGAITEDEEKRFKKLLPSRTNSYDTATYKLNELESLLKDTLATNGIGGVGGSGQSGTGGGVDVNTWTDEMKQVYLDGGGDPTVFSNDLSRSRNGSTSWGVKDLGKLSEKYESGGNPGAIGYDSTGGYSYGTYQLAHNNAKNFVDQSPYKNVFAGLTFNTKEWQNKWKEVAQKLPQQFAQAQKDYIAKTHFEPQVNKLAQAGFKNFSPVLADVIWSTAVQHGANNDVVLKALKKVGPNASDVDKIKAIYAERWSGGARFGSSTQAVKNSVYNRFFGKNGELALALQRLNVG